jgi:anti-sigma factor RsiW
MSDYLDATLSSEAVAELEKHLAVCEPCTAYLNTYKRTRDLVSQSMRARMPDELKVILRRFLAEQLAKGQL